MSSVRSANATSSTSRTERHGSFWYELLMYRRIMGDPGMRWKSAVRNVSVDERSATSGMRMGEISVGAGGWACDTDAMVVERAREMVVDAEEMRNER